MKTTYAAISDLWLAAKIALIEMQHTTAPRDSFSHAMNRLDRHLTALDEAPQLGCPKCAGDGSASNPYSMECPEGHAGRAAAVRIELDLATKAARQKGRGRQPRPAPGPIAQVIPAEFTPRESQVLSLLAEGMTNLQIAKEVGLAEKSVKGVMTLIFKKMRVKNRLQAVNAYSRFMANSQQQGATQ